MLEQIGADGLGGDGREIAVGGEGGGRDRAGRAGEGLAHRGGAIDVESLLPELGPPGAEQALLQHIGGTGAGKEQLLRIVGEGEIGPRRLAGEGEARRDGGDEVPEAAAARGEVDVVVEGLAELERGGEDPGGRHLRDLERGVRRRGRCRRWCRRRRRAKGGIGGGEGAGRRGEAAAPGAANAGRDPAAAIGAGRANAWRADRRRHRLRRGAAHTRAKKEAPKAAQAAEAKKAYPEESGANTAAAPDPMTPATARVVVVVPSPAASAPHRVPRYDYRLR